MSAFSTYPTVSLCTPVEVEKKALTASIQRYQTESEKGGYFPSFNYVVDVPVSDGDVERREKRFSASVQPAPSVCLFPALEKVMALPLEERRKTIHALAPFPKFDPAAVRTLPASKLLKLRREWLPYRQRFAVQQQRTDVLDAVLNHPVVSLVGGPGTGKTLQVPIVLSETDAFKRKRVVVVVANEVAALLTAARLREERGEEGDSTTVGVALSLRRDATEGSAILITTAETLVRQLLCDPSLVDVGVVVFDDVHIRNECTELCFFLLRQLLVASEGKSVPAPHLVLCSVCDVTPVVEYFKAVKHTVLTLSGTGAAIPNVLYAEDVLQWLEMCAKEGAKLCVDPAAELSKYATDVNVTHNAAKLTETDSSEKFSLLYDMALKSISFFDAADREEGKAASLIVVVGPDWTVLNRFCRLVPHDTYHCVRLVPGETAEDVFLRLAKGTLVAEEGAGKRCILFTTADLAQTILPASLDVGLLIDLAHDTERPVDPSTMSDSYRTGYANLVTLRNRRRGCKMLLQLIPKKILHHAQNRKVQVEHCLFSLPLERCVQLYGVLTALQTAQPSADHSSVAQRIAQLVKDIFIGVGGVANSKYEELRRLMIQVEQQLEAGGFLTARGKGHATTTPFTPIGVALLTLQLPLTISRLMLYSGVFDCTPVVCTLAALCVIGDIGISKVEEDEKWEEYCEGRKFFSSESNSDMVSSFNLFKMYLDTKANNEGDAFITEGCLSREKLTRVSQLQAEVYAFMLRTGLAVPSTPEEASLFQVVNEASVTAFEAKVREFPDKVMLQPSVVSCLSAAFYPNCAVLYGDGSAAIVDGLHHVPEAAKPVSFPRFGAFDANSVVQAASGGNPFLFLSKRVAITEQGALTRVSALNCGIPLESATVVVASGVGEEKPKRPPTRCRGWSSQLTTAWRSTTRARQLPPPAQLPPSSVALLPYDTIHSPNVVYTTDRSLSFTMRATTARWLLLFKKYTQLYLDTLVNHGRLSGDALGKELHDAWSWWEKRRRGGIDWLREDRKTALHTTEEERPAKLTPFFAFQRGRGVPPPMEPPKESTSAATAEEAPQVFTGAVPSADVEKVIRLLINDVKKMNSRDLEQKMLESDRVSFSFLDPDDEFHDFYLYLLRQTAPELHELGDNEEELIEFLDSIEAEVYLERKDAIAVQPHVEEAPKVRYQLDEFVPENADEVLDGGVQIEEATINIRKQPTANTSTAHLHVLEEPHGSEAHHPNPVDNGPTADNGGYTAPSAAELMALLMPKPPPNPMSEPPPPLPIKAIEDRKPSVLVYPIPQSRDNVPLQLAIALGETMNVRVGPTTIVGNVARIDVPNHKVELRALSLKRFTCVGQKVYIFKNDRIIDNPDLLVRRGGRGRGGGRGRDRGPPGDYGYRDEIGVDSRDNWYPQQQTGPDDGTR